LDSGNAPTLSALLAQIADAFDTVIFTNHTHYTDAVDALLTSYGLKGIMYIGQPSVHANWFSWAPGVHLAIIDSEVQRTCNYASLRGYMIGSEVRYTAYVTTVPPLTEAEFINWLQITYGIVRKYTDSASVYVDDYWVFGGVTPPPVSAAEIVAFGQARDGFFWSVGVTPYGLPLPAPCADEILLYSTLRQLSNAAGFKCYGRTGGYHGHWGTGVLYPIAGCFSKWLGQIYSQGGEGIALWRWESLYSTDDITGVFDAGVYAALVTLYQSLQVGPAWTILQRPKKEYARTVKNPPILSQSAFYGLTFHRLTTEYIDIPYSASLKPNTFSVEFFLKSTDTVNTPCAIFNPHGTDYSGAWHLRINSGGFGYLIINNGTIQPVSTGAKVTDGHWHRLGGYYDGAHMAVLVDRTFAAPLALTGNPAYDTQDLWVGIRHRSTSGFDIPFNGPLASIKLYNRILAAAEWDWNLQNPLDPVRSGLVLWLPLLEGQGTVVNDKSGLGNNGSIAGTVAWYEMAHHEPQADIL
jgi:hypothetical protein